MADNSKEQFSRIYDQYIEKIYRFVYLKVNSQEIAEDLTSKVFLKGWEAYKAKSTPSPDGVPGRMTGKIRNTGAFLYKIAGNTVIDYYREKGRTKTVSTESVPQIPDAGTGLQEKAIFSADVELVKSAIQKLKKDYQDIIIWHYLDDMPISEIAKNTGKPEGTVRVMLHRGLKELKHIIQES